jgi:hypothetical protein
MTTQTTTNAGLSTGCDDSMEIIFLLRPGGKDVARLRECPPPFGKPFPA